jgi:multiple sugar transport system substrate-binding protein
MWHWDSFLEKPYTKVGQDFTAKFPNITVKVEITSSGEYPQKVTSSVAGGVPPDLIGVTVTRADFLTFATSGQLTPLMPYIQRDKFDLSDFYDLNLRQVTWKGTLLALPYTWDTVAWFYNMDLFKSAGLTTPGEYWKQNKWDWPTYLDLASKLTKGSGLDKQWGSGILNPGFTAAFLPMIWSAGGSLLDQGYTKAALTSAADRSAFDFAYNVRKFAPGPEDTKTGTSQSGRVGIWPDWDEEYVLYRDQVKFQYGMVPPPASPGTNKNYFTGNAPGFGIPKGAKHPDDSWELLKMVESPDELTYLFVETYSGPPRRSLNGSIDMFKKNTQLADPSLAQQIYKAKEMANTPPKISSWAQMLTAMSEEMTLVWADKQSLSDGVQKVSDRWNQLLQGAVFDIDQS